MRVPAQEMVKRIKNITMPFRKFLYHLSLTSRNKKKAIEILTKLRPVMTMSE